MTGLTNFLAPFAQLLYANRSFAIVLLCGLLAWTTGNLFIARWRQQRLQQDLTEAKSPSSAGSGRTYATSSRRQMEEPPAESGGLPPVKGGRTYARNLGPALQKAGVTGPQIYSPPPPPGWVTSANAGQSPSAPPAPTPYATPNTQWAPPQAPASPWGYPGGASRPMPPAPPTPQAPFYPPPTSPAGAAPAAGPGLFAPPGAPGFGSPPLPPVTNVAPGAPAPPVVGPGFPGGPPMSPGFGFPVPGMGIPGPPEPDPTRGKPKRRRFNFNVLENLEKMVAPRGTDQPIPESTAPSAPPASVVPPPTLGSAAAPPLVPIAPPTPAAPTRIPPVQIPQVPALTPTEESLPLRFGRPEETKPWQQPEEKAHPAEAEPETHEPSTADVEPEPVVHEPELPVFESTAAAAPEATESAKPEPPAEPEPEPERQRSSGSAMRSMLFGHEDLPPVKSEPEREQAASAAAEPEPEPEPSSPASFRSRWLSQDEDFLKALDETATSVESTSEEVVSAPIEETPPPSEHLDEEPPVGVAETPVESAAQAPEETQAEAPVETPESISETPPVSLDEGPIGEVPEPPATGGYDKPSAGTLLIIEDDKTAAQYYETLFKGNGYRVEVANDGVSGVDLATRVQPDVILLDVMMPRQNGILVLQTLRASDETKNTPVVVMSNFSEPTLIKRAIQLGALEYVIKTQVEGPALITAVPRWMNREKAFAAAA